MNLKSWLRRVPHPSSVRLDRKDVVRINEGKTKWRDVLDVIEQHQPTLLEALDSNGHVLRATELQSDKDRDDDEKPAEKGAKTDLSEFARLLADAYKSGAEQHAAAFQLAFAENTKLVQVLAERLGGLEKAWQTTLEQRAEELAAAAANAGDGGESLLTGPLAPLIQGLLAKQLAAGDKPTVAKTNGAAKKGS